MQYVNYSWYLCFLFFYWTHYKNFIKVLIDAVEQDSIMAIISQSSIILHLLVNIISWTSPQRASISDLFVCFDIKNKQNIGFYVMILTMQKHQHSKLFQCTSLFWQCTCVISQNWIIRTIKRKHLLLAVRLFGQTRQEGCNQFTSTATFFQHVEDILI